MRPDLLVGTSADLVLLPAIWSETYSYVLTLALRIGLPVAAFDLGAPGERLRAYLNGRLPTYAQASDPAARGRLSWQIHSAEYESLMRNYYALENLGQMCSLQEMTFAVCIEAIYHG